MNLLHFQFLVLMIAGWVSRSQHDVIAYLQAENRVLREQLNGRRLLFTEVSVDDWRTTPGSLAGNGS